MELLERYQSQVAISPNSRKEYIEAMTDQQFREVGRKVVEVLRESPMTFLSFHIESERGGHLEPDPLRTPPTIQRMILDFVRLDEGSTAEVRHLLKIIERLQARLYRLESEDGDRDKRDA